MEKRLNGNGFLFFVKLLIRGVCRVIEIRLVKHGGLMALILVEA